MRTRYNAAFLNKWLARLAIVLAVATPCATARAQDDADDEADAPADGRVPVVRIAFLTDDQFDQQIFGRLESVESARARISRVVSARINEIDREYRLTEAQKEKLSLAGQGDLKRLFDRVEDLRTKYRQAKYERVAAIKCLQEARRLRAELATMPGPVDSLLSKTIATTITEEQKARHDDLLREYQSGQTERAIVEAAQRLARLLNLSGAQHRQLEQMLFDEIRPPARMGSSGYAFVMYRLSRLPENKVRPILSDSQWKFLHELLMPWNKAEKFLENDGFVLDEARPRWRPLVRVERRAQTGQ